MKDMIFSTNDKTKHNYSEEQHNNVNNIKHHKHQHKPIYICIKSFIKINKATG